jgi:hypothetical protein
MSTGVKAKLRVLLLADNVEVADSTDEALWQATLAAIAGKGISPVAQAPQGFQVTGSSAEPLQRETDHPPTATDSFAKELGLTADEVTGACDPMDHPPYIHLNAHYWEALKRNTPQRGIGAVGPAKLAATLLALWSRHCRFGVPTSGHVQDVLDTIHLADKNPGRAIQSCEWLQMRAGGIVLNPAETSRALALARAYCTKSPVGENA